MPDPYTTDLTRWFARNSPLKTGACCKERLRPRYLTPEDSTEVMYPVSVYTLAVERRALNDHVCIGGQPSKDDHFSEGLAVADFSG
jgi:hypothetical protein